MNTAAMKRINEPQQVRAYRSILVQAILLLRHTHIHSHTGRVIDIAFRSRTIPKGAV